MFSFWTKWTRDPHPHATPVSSWMQAFTMFLSVGGFKAPFVNKCDYIGMAIYKFRILSRSLLKMCAVRDDQFEDFFPDHETYVRWLPNFPREIAFPSGLFFMPKWNLTDTIARLVRLQAAVSIQFEVNQQCARIPPADFVEAVHKTFFLLHSTDLSADWHIPQFRRKVVPPAWASQILELRKNPQSLPTEVTCITQLALESWADMSQADIRSRISRPGKRFVAARERSRLLSKHLERFVELASLDNCNLPHLISPSWSPTHSCFCCDKTVPVGAQPWALQVTCRAASLPAADTLQLWRNAFSGQETLLLRILDTLQLRCPT